MITWSPRKVLGDQEILVETTFRTFRVRVNRFGDATLAGEPRQEARRLSAELRFALANGDAQMRLAAQRLRHELLEWRAVRGAQLDSGDLGPVPRVYRIRGRTDSARMVFTP